MKNKKYIISTLAVVFSLMTFSYSFADRTIMFKPGPGGKGAKGEVVIKNESQEMKEITVNATGLKPLEVYTTWLITMKPSSIPFMKPKMDMTGLGNGDYSFTADETGNAQYSVTIPSGEFKKWEIIKIAYHPDGNPKNMGGIVGALEADLK